MPAIGARHGDEARCNQLAKQKAAAGLLGCLQGQRGRGDISNNKQKKTINNKSKTIDIVDYILINRK